MLKIGITGAAGNIGSTLTESFKSKYGLTLLDRVAVSHAECESKVVDFADREQLNGVFNSLDILIHLAGNPSPSAPEEDTQRNNFLATSLVFDEAYRAGVKKIIFASSNFYHEKDITAHLKSSKRESIHLNDPATPESMYGKSKLFGEQIGLHYSHLGMQFVALRIGWTVPQDSPLPYDSRYMRAMFCSKRDPVSAFECAIISERPFQAGFAISDNDSKIFDLEETKNKLGFTPQDNSARY